MIFVERQETVALDPALSIAAIKDGEAHAIIAHQAVIGGQPEIAVAGLQDGVD